MTEQDTMKKETGMMKEQDMMKKETGMMKEQDMMEKETGMMKENKQWIVAGKSWERVNEFLIYRWPFSQKRRQGCSDPAFFMEWVFEDLRSRDFQEG